MSMLNDLDWARRDMSGNFYIGEKCLRCSGKFYTHALTNIAFKPNVGLCHWCRGECSAAEQQRRNELIEGGDIPIREKSQ